MLTKKKSKLISLAMSAMFVFTGTLGAASSKAYAASQIPELLITEVMPMSQNTDDAYEYLEIYNSSNNSIDLKDYKLPFQNIDITTSKVIPSKGVLVVCTRSNSTLQNFNSYYGTSLTDDKYMTLPLVNEMLSNSSSQSILLSKDDGNVIVRADYSTGDYDTKKSITYKYSDIGFDMSRLGRNQSPTPGSVVSSQIPYDGVNVTGITLDKSVATMEGSQTTQLYATVTPATATNKSVTWSSSDSKIVEVNASGILTAKSEGVATVTAKTVDGGYAAICVVIVKKVPTTGVSIDKSSITLDAGKAVILTATVSPENATNKSVTWTSSSDSVASVDLKGVVIGKSQGAAVITAKTADGGYTAFCTVVVNGNNINVPVTGVSLSKTNIALETGKAIVLEAQIKPTNATNKNVSWSSSNTDIATVDDKGLVTAKQPGVTVINARTADGGFGAYSVVTVANKVDNIVSVTGIKLDKQVLELKENQNTKLTAAVYPSDATNKAIKWSTNNSSVATVDSYGNIKALKEGVSIITATTVDNNLKDICVVIVKDVEDDDNDNDNIYKVTSVRLNKYTLNIKEGQSHKLVAIIAPGNASNKSVEWKSSNTKVAEITSDGRVIARGKGEAVITVTTKDGKYTAKCKVVVSEKKGKAKGHLKH
jgi:uncharacterized protein YjdB